jgi:uncharacterized protein (DUF302 family)
LLYQCRKAASMNAIADGLTYTIAERFDKVLKLIRTALAETELTVAGELDPAESVNGKPGNKAVRSRILLVDCPLLVFEALALDRAAAVFFPLHVLVSAAGDRTQVSVVNPAALFDARLPVGAAEPMERLQARVALALESVLLRSGTNNH